MTAISDVASFDDVPLLETTSVALGGEDGAMNAQAKALANRTKFLKDTLESFALDAYAAVVDLQQQIDLLKAKDTVTTLVSVAGVFTVDLSLGDYFILPMTEDSTIVFANPAGAGFGMRKTLSILQHATIPKTLTMPAEFGFAAGAPDTISSTAGEKDRLEIISDDNAATWAAALAIGIA